MRRLALILGIVVLVAAVAFAISRLLGQDAPPPPILPTATPTAGPITSVGDLYREEVRLNEFDVDGTDASYEQAIKAAAGP